MYVAYNSSDTFISKLEKVYKMIEDWKTSSHHLEASERYRLLNLISIKKQEMEQNVSELKKSRASNYDALRELIDKQLHELAGFMAVPEQRRIPG